MNFLFNLVFWPLVVIVLLPILAYSPVKTLIYIGVFCGLCIVIGLMVFILKHIRR